MTLTRLLRMPPGEIVGRGRQHAAHWRDRLGWNGVRTWGVETLSTKLTTSARSMVFGAGERSIAGSAHRLLDDFRVSAPARFFPGPSAVALADLMDRRMPDNRERLLVEADAASRGRFDLLGYRALDFGDPVDWHLDPVSHCRAPLRHASRIDPLDCALVGDSKVVWELNRHQWLVRLGQAWQLTGDGRYAKSFALAVRSWLQANPRGLGINWSSSLELAFRLIAWSWALMLFRRCDEVGPPLFGALLDAISDHAAHIERHLSYYFAPNTHLTGEALGLVYAGTVFPELSGARRWRDLGAEILLAQSERQQLPDGVYFEQATCYQRYTIEIYLHYLILARLTGLPIPPVLTERVQRLLDFLVAVASPDGSLPSIGDADGGWLLPLSPRGPDDGHAVFSTAAVLFERGDYAWAAGGLAAETLWLLGPEAGPMFDALRPQPPVGPASRVFPSGGWVVMRDSWNRKAHQLVLDVGPLGCPITSGHGHADLLSLQCAVFGEPYLVDPGTYCYSADATWRDFFRSSRAHSTVVVDGIDQATPLGPFAWRSRPRARLRDWRSCPDYDLADAEHDAYRGLLDPVRHRRRVVFVKPWYWLVIDDLDGRQAHRVEVRFQFAPLDVELTADLSLRARGRDGRGLLVRAFASVPLSVELRAGHTDPIQGWISPVYGQRRPAPMAVYATTAQLPLRVLTLLKPLTSADDEPPAITPVAGPHGQLVGLVVGGDEGRVIVRDDGIDLSGRQG